MRDIIKYIIIIVVVIGIALVIRNLFSSNSENFNNNEISNEERTSYKVTISLLAKDTDNFISDSVLAIRNNEGKIIEKWTTTDQEYVVNMVPKGTYSLEQISNSEGYKKNEETIEFTVEDKDIKLVMYNEKGDTSDNEVNNTTTDVPVVNTLSIKNPLSWILGIITIISGMGLIFLKRQPNR